MVPHEKEIKEMLRQFIRENRATYRTISTWNTTSIDATISKMIFYATSSQLMKKARDSFKNFESGEIAARTYMGSFLTIMENINKLIDIDKKNDAFLFYLQDVVSEELPDFNWKNIQILKQHNLFELNLISDFDSSFRGDIQNIHYINNGKYIIIETKAWSIENDPKDKKLETHFYCIEGEKRLSTYLWYTFEEALFYAICPIHSRAMMALYLNSQQLGEQK